MCWLCRSASRTQCTGPLSGIDHRAAIAISRSIYLSTPISPRGQCSPMTLWIIALLLIPLVTWSLRRRGRPWYRNQYSQRLIDIWTWSHFIGHGFGLYLAAWIAWWWITGSAWLDVPLSSIIAIVVIAETGWESLENRGWVLKVWRAAGDVKYFGDSIGNSAFDLLFCTAGAFVAHGLNLFVVKLFS